MQTSSPGTPEPAGIDLPVVVVDVDREAQPAALQLAAPHGQRGVAEREARHDVGAAGDRRQAEVVLDDLIDVVEALLGERAPGREHRPQVRELEILARHHTQLPRRVDVLGRRAEVGHPLLFGEDPERAPAIDERRAVEQEQRRPRGEAGDEPVPHHPAARGEVEQAVAALQVAVQQMLLEVLQQRAARAVHDAFRRAGGARRVQDVDRMVERQARILDRAGRVRRKEVVPADGAANRRHAGDRPARAFEIRHHDHPLHRWQLGNDLRNLVDDRQCLAVVPVAVDGHQHARLDLAEPVEHAAHAEIGRAGRPDGAERRRAQHRDDRLGQVRNEGGDAVARCQAGGLQRRRHPRHQRAELCVADARAIAVLAAKDERLRRIVAATRGEQVLGEIEAGVGKPARARHLVPIDERTFAALADDAGEIPEGPPERLALVVRPAPQCVIGRKRSARRVRDLAREFGDVRLRDPLACRLPEGSVRRHGRNRAAVPRDGDQGAGCRSKARSDPAILSGSGTGRPLARSTQTIFAAPSANLRPSCQTS